MPETNVTKKTTTNVSMTRLLNLLRTITPQADQARVNFHPYREYHMALSLRGYAPRHLEAIPPGLKQEIKSQARCQATVLSFFNAYQAGRLGAWLQGIHTKEGFNALGLGQRQYEQSCKGDSERFFEKNGWRRQVQSARALELAQIADTVLEKAGCYEVMCILPEGTHVLGIIVDRMTVHVMDSNRGLASVHKDDFSAWLQQQFESESGLFRYLSQACRSALLTPCEHDPSLLLQSDVYANIRSKM